MNHLLRALAPITDRAWEEIEREARRTLKASLAARRLVDFEGPKGWDFSSVANAHEEPLITELGGILTARVRRVQPMVELRRTFDISRTMVDAIERGAKDADFDPAIEAAKTIALAEDRLVFHGCSSASVVGICDGAASAALTIGDDYQDYPALVATAVSKLRDGGVDGPYAIALGRRCYTGLTEAVKEGYPVLQHVQRLLGGPLIWAPALDGAVVVSMRGDDFELVVGQDLSMGYLGHDDEKVRLYIEESLTFRLLSSQAAIPLVYRG